MSTQDAARAALVDVAARRAQLANDEAGVIVAALRAEVGVVEVAKLIERSREHVRKVAREHGIKPRGGNVW